MISCIYTLSSARAGVQHSVHRDPGVRGYEETDIQPAAGDTRLHRHSVSRVFTSLFNKLKKILNSLIFKSRKMENVFIY